MSSESSFSPSRKRAREESGPQAEQCPRVINVTEFVEARALEITQLLAVVNNTSLPAGEVAQGPRTFVQRLPRHMRRRAMSYNIKRLPRRLRSMAKATIEESKHRTKPPSRRWRRRPSNLLNAYLHRQRKIAWLETHIWHAKRFRMTEIAGWRLPDRAYQRGFRASYRDTIRHCVVQDLSFYVCFELEGPEKILVERMNRLCQPSVSCTFSNTTVLRGVTEATATLYEPECYPHNCIGPVRFAYRPRRNGLENRALWIWTHPAIEVKILDVLQQLFEVTNIDAGIRNDVNVNDCAANTKESVNAGNFCQSKWLFAPTYVSPNKETLVTLRILKHNLVRFRLMGPKSGSILAHVLREPAAVPPIFKDEIYSEDLIRQQWAAWRMYCRVDPGRISPGLILSLTASDPRLFRGKAKSFLEAATPHETHSAEVRSTSATLASSPIWSHDIRRHVLERKLNDYELNEMRHKRSALSNDADLTIDLEKTNSIPILLIQQPSYCRDHLGLYSGWDLVLPAGWAMPFWIALQYATARAIGLDFQQHLSVETVDQSSAFPRFWPDTEAGQTLAKKEAEQLTKRSLSRPANRRVNYENLRITHPFVSPWNELVSGWSQLLKNGSIAGCDHFFVLRDRVCLRMVEKSFKNVDHDRMNSLCEKYSRALIAVRLSSLGKGVPKPRALVCLPTKEDLVKILSHRTMNEREPTEAKKPVRDAEASAKAVDATQLDFIHLGAGENADEVDLNRFFEDKVEKRAIERKRKKERKKGKRLAVSKREEKLVEHERNDEIKVAGFENVVTSCHRKILGYVVNGEFSLANGRGQATAFCSLLGLKFYKDFLAEEKMVNAFQCIVLYRNVNSKYYRAAGLSMLDT